MKKIAITILLSFFISNCGFKTLYSNNEDYLNDLASIRLELDKNRLYQNLESNLKEELNPNGIDVEKKYILTIDLTKKTQVTFINPTGSSGRNKITLTAKYNLRRIENDEIVATGEIYSKDDFDVEDKRFANYISEESIGINLTKLIATNIRNSLINDFISLLETTPSQ